MESRNAVVNLQPRSTLPVIRVSQYDVGVPLKFVVYDGDSPADLASGTTATIQATRPSGTGFKETCSVSGNIVTVNTTQAMTQEAGTMTAEIRLVSGSTNVGTSNFSYVVEQAAHADDVLDADVDQWNAIAQRVREDTQQSTSNVRIVNESVSQAQAASSTAVEASQNASRSAETALAAAQSAGAILTSVEESASDSEAYAVGKRDGKDVASTDVAYHNNAKYYAEQAAGSAASLAISIANNGLIIGTT